MSLTDRELLELAAKAAGYSSAPYFEGDYMGAAMYDYTDGPSGWNPLRDDGDAFRLAANLGLCVDFYTTTAAKENTVYVTEHKYKDAEATRRAIVRAAANIGEAK